MNAVIIFDLQNDSGNLVRERMRSLGYSRSWSITKSDNINAAPQKTSYALPHNTLWKSNTTFSQAMLDLNEAISFVNSQNNSNISLLRCIVLNSTPWNGIPGIPTS